MLIGAIGCNLAWGLIDAVMYLMSCLTERRGASDGSDRQPCFVTGGRMPRD
ncbi:MAG TPA: hypothetical protein VFX71_09210 [Hyphomicrobium sp.]|nr:hypothetical protein [Hyphomicrobium sp.]